MKNEETTTADTAAAVAAQGAHVASEKNPAKKQPGRKNYAHKGSKTAKGAKLGGAKKAGTPRAEGKGAKILEMISRGKGETLAEIMKATGWQAHSVRGFLSTAAKKQGIKIESTKTEAGDRLYTITK
jgi:hypothetical protein